MTESQRNPESDVLDEIDRQIERGRIMDQYHNGIPICPVCGTEWHGLRGDGTINGGRLGCPGEYGTLAEIRRWHEDYEARVAVPKRAWK